MLLKTNPFVATFVGLRRIFVPVTSRVVVGVLPIPTCCVEFIRIALVELVVMSSVFAAGKNIPFVDDVVEVTLTVPNVAEPAAVMAPAESIRIRSVSVPADDAVSNINLPGTMPVLTVPSTAPKIREELTKLVPSSPPKRIIPIESPETTAPKVPTVAPRDLRNCKLALNFVLKAPKCSHGKHAASGFF